MFKLHLGNTPHTISDDDFKELGKKAEGYVLLHLKFYAVFFMPLPRGIWSILKVLRMSVPHWFPCNNFYSPRANVSKFIHKVRDHKRNAKFSFGLNRFSLLSYVYFSCKSRGIHVPWIHSSILFKHERKQVQCVTSSNHGRLQIVFVIHRKFCFHLDKLNYQYLG